NYEFSIGAYFKSKKGEIFFGGISGINSFFPDSIKINRIPPKIAITEVEIVAKNKKTLKYPSSDDVLHIPYKNNLITVEFSVLDYTNPKQNTYAYKLKGAGDEWINIGNRRYATFSKLAPGKYTFIVKGANSDYVWNEEGVSLDIIVKTPIWKKDISYVVYIVLIISLILFLVQYRTRHLRKTNLKLKEKELIAIQVAKQKEELSVKNKSITDSIIYAKRIQESLLPSKIYFKELLPKSFILFKPKDIVSGDFYWVAHKANKIFLAVVDCTGHGVPGAFMSIIGFELLRNIINEQNIQEADEIMSHLNKGIIDTLGKSDDISIKDGMDMSLCVIDRNNSILEYSGAFRPLYMIRDNKLDEIKGGRFSVGMLDDNENDKILKTVISIEKDDVFYMFSDGYADQFGGPEGKKYKYRRFRHMLLNIHRNSLEKQKEFLDKSIEDWKGNEEQVDDILIVGIKPY
ncbi:MAG: SpoIIE family protein phosphatase, partial [Bacteroidota bacterium]|nr:SpoIIE family protein phosphatase [Bacteroidota bacterium]